MWHFSKPSVWVTAWVVRVVMAAQLEDWENQIYIEPRFVSSSVSYLIKHQDDQGGFHESIHYRNTSLLYTMNFKGWSDGSTSEGEEEQPLVALTALIVMVLHEALPTLTGNVHADALQAKLRAVSLLERVVEQLWDPYEVAITTYALTLVDSPEKDVAYSILQSISRKTSGGGLYWSRDEVNSNERQSQNNQRNFLLPKESDHWDSYAIESTGYGLLTMLLREGVTPRAESTVRWLTSVREWDLAFSGTVDTVVALMALAEYSYRARLREVTRMNVRVEASSSPGLVHTVVITNQSIAAIHNIKVPRPWGHVSLEAKGSGQAVAQLEMTWGVDLPRYLRKAPRKYFDLRVTETFPFSRNKSIIATRVCVRWAAEDLSASSHAAFLEVDVATGYFLSQPESNKAVRKAHAQDMPMLIDVKATPNTMYWQFTHIPGDRSRCFTYDLRRQHPVANLTQVRAAHIFELFAPEHFETTMINASSLSALDICEVCGSYQCPYCPSYSGRSSTLLPHHTMLLLFPMLPSLLIPFPQQPGILTTMALKVKCAVVLFLVVMVTLVEAQSPSSRLSNDVVTIIEQWAPLIWLHPEEMFFPSTVDFHLEHVEVRDENETTIQEFQDRYTIVTGPDTRSYHLNTVPNLTCGDCLLEWFGGQNVSQESVPTYVFVKDYQDACGTVDVAYRSFYPYNYGKDVCVEVMLGGECDGIMQSFGNHVGDWEHYSIRIRNGSVTDCYVSVHSFGAWYTWNQTNNNFQFVDGEQSRINLINVTYPETVEVVNGFHAELFSANGSHGLWSAEGTHEYVHLPIHLQDQAQRGYQWRTWENLDIVLWDPDTEYLGEQHYLDYRGKWGNLEMGCGIIETVSGECILGNGPGLWQPGPGDFADDCPL
ncbi:hypothetical protein Pcinc_017750 [Petrolisthes cinctipes]|uniref:C3 and PZP-like alpha-2-macroglobulin domain-containing protein 8 n=1 Tax=Petrolisthes cinctipes TaxID=88211 RepID=A0AAE1FNL7_PETCI|nr:hypothetical protein Pcinc_017750 [Petrolisthes cinctipes]